MVRSTRLVATITLTVCTLAAAVACNNAADDANKAKTAQAMADDKSGAATRESDEKAKNAQAEAETKIAAAHADHGRRIRFSFGPGFPGFCTALPLFGSVA